MSQAMTDVVNDLSQIPPFPKVTATLLRLLDEPDTSVEELATVISSDPKLMLTVTHVANSPFYMCPRRVENIKDAVLVLGISTIKGITTTISVQQGIKKLCSLSSRFDPVAYWKHSFATANLAGHFALDNGTYARDRAYFAGLVHDVGKVFQAYYWPDSWDTVLKLSAVEGTNYSETEEQIFGFQHFDIAAQVLAKWQFPRDIIESLQCMNAADSQAKTAGCSELLTKAHRAANSLGYLFPAGDSQGIEPERLAMVESLRDACEEEIEYQLRVLSP